MYVSVGQGILEIWKKMHGFAIFAIFIENLPSLTKKLGNDFFSTYYHFDFIKSTDNLHWSGETKNYLVCNSILGMLMHTGALGWHLGGDETLKGVSVIVT